MSGKRQRSKAYRNPMRLKRQMAVPSRSAAQVKSGRCGEVRAGTRAARLGLTVSAE
ncbi:hypothetical protein NDS46_19430 [Paenibacillus thiaminolyticus]|uniref:hypothetical protein n=1 Tax=Paenibacillus thiaminolyticus TaxID=49283 RepID=UPI00232D2EB5|nr:hypothetical protein [Paenibacillus thiaminolyticus]WCF06517.1 hypothetical protein NDS46_19430 [Paenibacillus thiaminolyticus]